jgi:hypothetical protein
MQENKCKMLEIIPFDLDKNHCEIITSLCFQMLSNVLTKNVTISRDEQVLYIIEGVQIVNVDVNDEESSGRNKGKDDLQALTISEIPPPPPIDNGRLGYV